MKKITAVCMCGLMAAALMTGCGKKAAVDSVKLGDYKGVTFTPVTVDVTDEQVEAEIQGLLEEHAVETEVDRAAKDGDIVNIDFVGMKDGVAFDGGTGSDYDLVLGSGSFIDGFEDGLIGAVKGQELSLNLTFPEVYQQNEELAGQDVVFDVTVNAVKESTEAELTDAFIKENTDSDTIADYREATKANLLATAEADAEDRKKSEVFQKVMEASEITVAEATIDTYYNEQLANYEKQASQAGTDLATMASYFGTDLDTFKSQLRSMAEEASKQNLVVKAIAEAENITITDDEKAALAVEFGYTDTANMIETVGDTAVDNYILAEKVVTFIADNAVEA